MSNRTPQPPCYVPLGKTCAGLVDGKKLCHGPANTTSLRKKEPELDQQRGLMIGLLSSEIQLLFGHQRYLQVSIQDASNGPIQQMGKGGSTLSPRESTPEQPTRPSFPGAAKVSETKATSSRAEA